MIEELNRKAIEYIRKTKCNPKDRPNEQIEILHEEELEMLIGFATEATKELQEDLNHKKIAIKSRKARIKELEKQNKEAKEIIREFTWGFSTQGQYDRLQEKAESFLKENE